MRIALGVTPISPGSPWSEVSSCALESRIGPVSHGQGPPPWLRKYVGSNSPGPVVGEVSVIGVLVRRTPDRRFHGPAARRRRLGRRRPPRRSEEPTSELQSLMRISYAVFCLTHKRRLTPCHKQ